MLALSIEALEANQSEKKLRIGIVCDKKPPSKKKGEKKNPKNYGPRKKEI